MSRLEHYPALEKQKTFFRLGQKSFKCNHCGRTHSIERQQAIQKCLDAVLRKVPPADFKSLVFYKTFQNNPKLLDRFLRAKDIDYSLRTLFWTIGRIAETYGKPRTCRYLTEKTDLVTKAAFLSMPKEEQIHMLRAENTGDADMELQTFFEMRFSEERVEYVLSGQIYDDNPSEHDWDLVIDPETNAVRTFRSYQGGESSYYSDIIYNNSILGDPNKVEVKISREGIHYRSRITMVHHLIPFDWSIPIKTSIEHL